MLAISLRVALWLAPIQSRSAALIDAYNQFTELYAWGRYAVAEPLYERSLANQDKILGPNHPELGTSHKHKPELYRAQGHSAEAELSIERELGITDILTVWHVKREGRRRP